MEKKIKIGLIVLIIGVVVISGWVILNKPIQEVRIIDNEKYCEKDSDCVFLDFIRCCPPPDPCKRKSPEVVNKESKEKVEQEMKAECPPTCPYYEAPQCSHCLNIEEFTPVCIDNKCTIKREINCEEYCKAIVKDESEPCPWISNPNLITEENTKKCGCKTESDCKDGKIINSVCLRDEISCNKNDDCTFGLNCGHFCYNKNYKSWYEEFSPICRWDYPISGTVCECITGFCEVKYPPKCSTDKDCPNELKCSYGYCQ